MRAQLGMHDGRGHNPTTVGVLAQRINNDVDYNDDDVRRGNNDSICINPRRNKMRKKIKSVFDIVLSVNPKKNEVTTEKVTFYHVQPR